MSSAPAITKGRVEWVDTAKGICIALVVFNHVFLLLPDFKEVCPSVVYYFFNSFRMPLYFFLSGLFFKTYGSFGNFATKKTNKLIIPFLFFYLVSCGFRAAETSMLQPGQDIPVLGYVLDFYQNHCQAVNGPLWFLLCLFEVNIIFFVLYTLCRNRLQLGVCSALCGILGLSFSYWGIDLPVTVDTAFTCTPFYFAGHYVRHHTGLLYTSPVDNHLLLSAGVCSLPSLLIARYVMYYTNTFYKTAYFTAHLCGIAGSLMILLLSKWMGKIPVVTYWGRYSIIILCTHIIILNILTDTLFSGTLTMLSIITLFLTLMLIETLLIPVFVKYLPYVTAQKDLLRS